MGTIKTGNIIEADDILSSMRTTVEAGEGITEGNVCYIKESDGKAYISDSSSASYFTGIAYATVSSGEDVTLITKGKFVTTGLSDKEIYYLGSSGAISTTMSPIRIGSADGTTDLYIDTGVNNEGSGNVGLKNIKLNPFGILATAQSEPGFIFPYTSTRWEMQSALTTDGGTTKSTGTATQYLGWQCKADVTKALNSSTNGATMLFTIDSGATWTATTTEPPNITSYIRDADYTVDGLIYIAGIASSGTGLWYSTDDGDTFTQVSSPASEDFAAVGMYDATHGVAVRAASGSGDPDIYYTTDGTTWTDSGDKMTSESADKLAGGDVYCYASGETESDFKALLLCRDGTGVGAGAGGVGNLEFWQGGAGVNSYPIFRGGAGSVYGVCSNLTLLDNGALCFTMAQNFASDGDLICSVQIVATTNPTVSALTTGTISACPTFYQVPIGLAGDAADSQIFAKGSQVQNQINNKLLIASEDFKLFEINLGGL